MLIALLFPNETISFHDYFRPYLTPEGNNCWKQAQFIVNPTRGSFDAIIVHQSIKPLSHTYQLKCPPSKTLLVIKEPPDILFLPENYTRQFYCTLGQDKRVKSKVKVFSQAGHHWFVEIKINDALISDSYPKSKLLSAVVSNKEHTTGHRKRLNFMYALKEHFGNRLDWFGRGINDLGAKKVDALLDYKYHIVLENGVWSDYWTEKLADAFVTNCFPFYWGASNIHDYFNSKSLELIDVNDIKGSIKIIEDTISNDIYEKSQSIIATARKSILTEYHPYQIYLNILSKLPKSEPQNITITPHTKFRHDFTSRLQLGIKNQLRKLDLSFF